MKDSFEASPQAKGAPLRAARGATHASNPASTARPVNAKAAFQSSKKVAEDRREIESGNKLMDAYGRLHDASTPIHQIPAYQPANGVPFAVDNPRIYVNGVFTDAATQRLTAQRLANASGEATVAFRNATEPGLADISEALRSKRGFSTEVSQSLAKVLFARLKDGKPVTVEAHSQGAIIASEAQIEVKKMLIASGMPTPRVEQAMHNLTIITHGGASQTYMDGSKYTHNLHEADAVANLTGLGTSDAPFWYKFLTHPGKDAQIHWSPPPGSDAHGINGYLKTSYGPHQEPVLPNLMDRFSAGFSPPSSLGNSFGFGPFGTRAGAFSAHGGTGIGTLGTGNFHSFGLGSWSSLGALAQGHAFQSDLGTSPAVGSPFGLSGWVTPSSFRPDIPMYRNSFGTMPGSPFTFAGLAGSRGTSPGLGTIGGSPLSHFNLQGFVGSAGGTGSGHSMGSVPIGTAGGIGTIGISGLAATGSFGDFGASLLSGGD
ncbi:hypothetical protein SAMN05444354_10374 [Stigmatella aurantiaca]|uniref:Uncharacterized protein n=1 Tax=Stigmatella aurantiaca TaxID=41 RepID=A0A1H7KZV2_STIAU|nr:hypothetical protein [Stigmatella aurantiaca]SEK92104.1 hypothetical protein SAMN05444354_10374 [Stigmatella aurantiaca]